MSNFNEELMITIAFFFLHQIWLYMLMCLKMIPVIILTWHLISNAFYDRIILWLLKQSYFGTEVWTTQVYDTLHKAETIILILENNEGKVVKKPSPVEHESCINKQYKKLVLQALCPVVCTCELSPSLQEGPHCRLPISCSKHLFAQNPKL